MVIFDVDIIRKEVNVKENFKSAVHMIIKDNNKILVQKRKGTKLWLGYYALPAGHIDEGENQYEAVIREAKEELDININIDDLEDMGTVLRKNYFEIDGKKLDPYIDFYFLIKNYKGTIKIAEENKCDELLWVDKDHLPKPFINYEGDFLDNKNIKTYDCKTQGSYVKNIK